MATSVSQRKLILMILMGCLLETYDYSLFGYFAALIAKLFFPTFDSVSSLLLTFLLFAVGFIARPVGAAIFGHFGDKYGRRKMLMWSIVLMALPTTLMGMLPTYAQIGLAAGVILAVCRLLQGLAVGAEFVGTMVYMIEQAPAEKRTYYGSLCICIGYAAMMFTALFITTLTHVFSDTTMNAWAWRIPFLFGAVLGLLGLYIRNRLPESPAFAHRSTPGASPFWRAVREMPITLLQAVGVVMLHALGFYLLFVYFGSFLTTAYHLSAAKTALINLIVLAIAIIAIPFIGRYAEKANKRHLILISCSSLIICSYPLFHLLSEHTFLAILAVQTSLTLLVCLTSAVLPAFLAEIFPVSLRFTGMALSYNISAVLFGGTAPLVLTYLANKTELMYAPAYYLIFAAFVTLVCTLMIKNNFAQRFAIDLPAEPATHPL